MTAHEIRVRQMTNQHLLAKADKLTVVRDLCGVQAQFMPNALHSLRIRSTDFDEATVAQGLVKNWTIRGTVHVFAERDLPLFKHCENGTTYRLDRWRGYGYWTQKNKQGWVWSLTPERQAHFSELIVRAVSERSMTRDELKDLCTAHGMTEEEKDSMFDQWGGGIRDLCERGFMNYVVQEKKAYTISPDFTPIPEEEAKLEMARRYFTHIAPATLHDAMYFFGTTAAQVKEWLSCLPVVSAECGGKTYYYIESGISYDRDIPPCLLLAGFDQLMLGYQKKESLYLDPAHLRGIFNLAGIVMPPILLHGRVVGKWKKKDRTLTLTLFESLGENERQSITAAAEELWQNIAKIQWE